MQRHRSLTPIPPDGRSAAPLVDASTAGCAAIESLVQRILDAKGGSGVPPDSDRRDGDTTCTADVSCWESEIDEIVERMYFGEQC